MKKASKPLLQILCFAVLGIGAFAACKSSPKLAPELAALPAPLPPDGYKPSDVTLLNLEGENCCAQYVGDRSQLVFLSRKRSRHNNFQIYVYDLELKKERRLSFHDGDDQGPQVDPQTGEFYYASLTDSLKESPRFLQEALGKPAETLPNMGRRPLWQADNFDLYRAKRDGTDIHRLTDRPGFDAEIRLHPKGKGIVFTAYHQGQSKLMRADNNGKNVTTLTRSNQSESEATFSPNAKEFAWVRYAADFQSSQIWVANIDGKNARAITSGEGLRWSPVWSPDSQQILFSSNDQQADNFEIYVINRDGKCLRRLTYTLGNDLLPAWSSHGRQIMFSSDRGGSFQLYSQLFEPPACPAN